MQRQHETLSSRSLIRYGVIMLIEFLIGSVEPKSCFGLLSRAISCLSLPLLCVQLFNSLMIFAALGHKDVDFINISFLLVNGVKVLPNGI